MMGFKNQLIFLIGCLFSLLAYQNCAPFEGNGDTTFGFSFGEIATFAQVKTIIDGKCLSCHEAPTVANGYTSLADYDTIIDSGLVVPGNAIISTLYQVVEDGTMPVGKEPLSLLELEAIRTWIDSGAPDQGGISGNDPPVIIMPTDRTIQLPIDVVSLSAEVSDPDGQVLSTLWSQISGPVGGNASLTGDRSSLVTARGLIEGVYVFELVVEDDFGAVSRGQVQVTVQSSGGAPDNGDNVVAARFSDVNAIFQQKCKNCHEGNNAQENKFSIESYNQVMLKIAPNNLNDSEVYTRVLDDDMPRGNNSTPLSQAQKDTIRSWILDGAQNN